MTVGIPKIEKYIKPKRLSKWQKYLLGKKEYDSLNAIFTNSSNSYPPKIKFKDLSGKLRKEWIDLALMDFTKF